jgi:hypothetical protein
MDHVIDPEFWKPEGRVVVVEFQGAEAGGVRLKGEDEDIGHEAHVFLDVLGDAIGWARHIGLGEGRSPSLEFALASGLFDALFHLADGVKIFIDFLSIRVPQTAAQATGVGEDGIEHALIAAAGLGFEEAVEGEGWV